MNSGSNADPDGQARERASRDRLVQVGGVATIVSVMHFIDHVIRGQIVVDRGLNPDWNHSGWPFQSQFNPFTMSLILVFGLLLGGVVFTLRRRLWAGYWLVTSIVLGALVLYIHFLEGEKAETPSVIMQTYDRLELSIPALMVLISLIGVLIAMAMQAVRARQVSGRWL